EALSEAKNRVNPSITEHYEYSAEREKAKQMFSRGVYPERFKVLQPLAKGMSYKDMTDSHLSNYGKGDLNYHRPPSLQRSDLKDSLALATAIAEKAAEYRNLGFTHNDLKPENFMTRRRPDGSYIVEFIDWATAGFRQHVVPTQEESKNPQQLFKRLFRVDPSQELQTDSKGTTYTAEGGRFLTYQVGNAWYGVNPSLEILYGKRNCTLPYIGPKVVDLGEDNANSAQDASVKNPEFTTHLESDAPGMDNWALTALSFGICNRKAYFKLAHGRAVMDYTVPGVIDAVVNDLVIKNATLFDEYFSPEVQDNLAAESTNIDENPRAVMYIPSTEREGQPIHLYLKLKDALLNTTIDRSILDRIRSILTTVHRSVAEGTGLTLENLQAQLKEASDCLHEIEQQKIAQETREKTQAFNAVLEQFSGSRIDNMQLLTQAAQNTDLKNIEILCTYPPTHHDRLEPGPVDSVLAVLGKVDAAWFETHILSNDESSPLRNLLQLTIEHQQPKILSALLEKLAGDPKLYPLIAEQGLLQYALQQGMTRNAEEMIDALKEADKTKDDILHLLLATYGPGAEKPYITWNKNALHAAIRNNNLDQLSLILDNLPLTQETPDARRVRAAIDEALYFSADLLNSIFFQTILRKYDAANPEHRITTQEILSIHSSEDGPCPYHFFLRDSATNINIPWFLLNALAIDKNEENKELVKRFLTQLPHPFVIAAINRNFKGLFQLMELARSVVLSPAERRSLLLQTDLQGANLLNHVIDSCDQGLITQFIQELYQQPDMDNNVLYMLLSNQKNPLTNILKSPITLQQNKYPVFKMLLSNLATTEHDEEQQRQVRNILLMNGDWLIEEGGKADKGLLDDLFGLAHFSQKAKLSLFQALEEMAQKQRKNTAATYYQSLCQTLQKSPVKRGVPTVALDFNPQDLAVIRRQRGDGLEELTELLAASNLRYETLRAENLSVLEGNRKLEEEIGIVRARNTSYDREKKETLSKITAAEKAKVESERKFAEIQDEIKKLRLVHESEKSQIQEKNQGDLQSMAKEKEQAELNFKTTLSGLQDQLSQALEELQSSGKLVVSLEGQLLELSALQEDTQRQVLNLTQLLHENQLELSKQKKINEDLERQYDLLKVGAQNTSTELNTLTLESQDLIVKLERTENKLKELERKGQESSLEAEKLRGECE
ncbi:MAG: hypothetical protein NTZ86_00425, partial [Legionellales bacterium]|nr:hypothetical protein [Legionellales bacterium]